MRSIFPMLILFLVTVSATAFSADSGRDLSDLFNPRVQIQNGGTCHIYSSIALFEAGCYARTGKRIDLSEAAIYLQHLKAEWDGSRPPIKVEVKQQVVDGTLYTTTTRIDSPNGTMPLLPQIEGNITGMDGGDPKKTLELILDCSTCVREQDLPFDTRFIQAIDDIVRTYGRVEAKLNNQAVDDFQSNKLSKQSAVAIQTEARHSARVQAVAELNSRFAKFLTAHKQDPDIETCRAQRMTAVALGRVPTTTLKAELDNGYPVLCSVDMSYQLPDGSRTAGSPHSLLVIGYRTNERGGLDFLLRDSNRDKPSWNSTVTGCRSALVLR